MKLSEMHTLPRQCLQPGYGTAHTYTEATHLFACPLYNSNEIIAQFSALMHIIMCERSLPSLPYNNFHVLISEQLVSQASSVKDVACDVSECLESRNQCCI